MKHIELSITVLVSTLIMAGVLITGFGKVDRWLELRKETQRTDTIIACANASRYTYSEQSDNWERTTTEPSQKFYEECLKLNSIQTQ